MTVRTRFAPSPTGSLHIGSARTALYCWLYAKKYQGKYILRIEDTDRERSTQSSINAILESLDWLGLTPDEGPFYQTNRFDRYREIMEQWLVEGKAYRCYCSKERLDKLREKQLRNKEKPRYDGHCRKLKSPNLSQPFVVRFANPIDGDVIIPDLIKREVTISNRELDDLIIWRSDDTPTYNFTVVIDDWDMKITHVIRGDDHLNNTPRQINMLHALKAPLPQYAHVAMILGKDGKRLSKRHGATGVMQYRDDGYLPQALLNYLVRLGWSYGDQEIFSQDELISLFDLNTINKAASTFNPEKLVWVNQHYIKTLPAKELIPHLEIQCHALNLDLTQGPGLADLIEAQRDRSKTLKEMAENSRFFFEPFTAYDEKAKKKFLTSMQTPILSHLIEKFTETNQWEKDMLHTIIKQTATDLALKMGAVAQPIRVALTGNTISPSIDITLVLMGREKTLTRLKQALDKCAE